MAYIQINLDEDINKKIKIYQAKNGIRDKKIAILKILKEHLK